MFCIVTNDYGSCFPNIKKTASESLNNLPTFKQITGGRDGVWSQNSKLKLLWGSGGVNYRAGSAVQNRIKIFQDHLQHDLCLDSADAQPFKEVFDFWKWPKRIHNPFWRIKRFEEAWRGKLKNNVLSSLVCFEACSEDNLKFDRNFTQCQSYRKICSSQGPTSKAGLLGLLLYLFLHPFSEHLGVLGSDAESLTPP